MARRTRFLLLFCSFFSLYLLVFAVVASDGAVGSLSLAGLAIGSVEDRGHEAEGTIALGNDIGLDVTIIVLGGPDEVAIGLESLGNHVINEAVLVPDAKLLELGLVLGLVDFLKDVLEAAVIRLENGVLGRQVQGELALNGETEARVRKALNGLIRVVHGKTNTARLFKVEHLELFGIRAISRSVHNLKLAGARSDKVGGAVLMGQNHVNGTSNGHFFSLFFFYFFYLVTVSVAADDDGAGPARHKTGERVEDDGLTEHSAVQNVAERAIGRLPHLLQVEF